MQTQASEREDTDKRRKAGLFTSSTAVPAVLNCGLGLVASSSPPPTDTSPPRDDTGAGGGVVVAAEAAEAAARAGVCSSSAADLSAGFLAAVAAAPPPPPRGASLRSLVVSAAAVAASSSLARLPPAQKRKIGASPACPGHSCHFRKGLAWCSRYETVFEELPCSPCVSTASSPNFLPS